MPTKPLTPEQKQQAVEAVAKYGGVGPAARALGISRTTLQSRLRRAEISELGSVGDGGLVEACHDSGMREHATVRQWEIADAVCAAGSIKGAAEELNIDPCDVRLAIKSLRAKASVQGYAPPHGWTKSVPSTHVAKGVSTYYPAPKDKDGRAIGPAQWLKADLRQEAYNEMVRGAISAFVEEVPEIDAAPAPLDWQSDVIPWLQIGDAHIGMLAHAAETGENFDLKIAERELCAAFATLIDELPTCERLVINDLGDGTHYDNVAGTTAQSGHQLDIDGRIAKMLRVYSKCIRFAVTRALTKARVVDVIINQGNHSRVNDFWMSELLRAAYGHTGRVNVLDNTNVFVAYRMGDTLVMTHHSDKCKGRALVDVMTTDYRKDFGETRFHYIDVGHVHHKYVAKEHPGIVIEAWNNLAAKDKYAHEGGWRSRRAMSVVLRSRTYGEIGRRVLPIEEIHDRILRATGHVTPQPSLRALHSV